jgi:hypothetical protein
VAKIAIGKIRALTFGVSEILGGIEGEIKQGIEQSDLIGLAKFFLYNFSNSFNLK